MITAIVRYPLPPAIDRDACRAHYASIAPGFRDVPGLISKHFIWSERGYAGGVYQWESREAAQAFYSGPGARASSSATASSPRSSTSRCSASPTTPTIPLRPSKRPEGNALRPFPATRRKRIAEILGSPAAWRGRTVRRREHASVEAPADRPLSFPPPAPGKPLSPTAERSVGGGTQHDERDRLPAASGPPLHRSACDARCRRT